MTFLKKTFISKKILFFFINQLLLYSKVSTLSCIIKLACKDSCNNNIQLKNGKTNNINDIPLINVPISLGYKQFHTDSDNQFNCEPGDTIIIINTNENNEGGILCHLIIKDNNDNIIKVYKTTDSDNKFNCNYSTCILGEVELQVDGEPSQEKIYGYSGMNTETFSIRIPYNYNINNNDIINFSNLKGENHFNIKDYFNPDLAGAETDGRVFVVITEIPDSESTILKKSNILNFNIFEKFKINFYYL